MKAVRHIGDPVGAFEDINGLNTYVSHPAAKQERYQHIILYFADVWSPLFKNNQLLMDFYASNGYLVLGPDCFEGEPVNKAREKPDFDPELWWQPKRERANETVPTWIEAAKAKYGTERTKYAAVGYCFGASDVLNCAATDWLSAGAIVHPAFLNESHFTNVKQPVLLSCAETDYRFPTASRHRAEELLVGTKAEYHFQLFSGVEHGFAIRGDPSVPRIKWSKEESARSVVGWFDRFCK